MKNYSIFTKHSHLSMVLHRDCIYIYPPCVGLRKHSQLEANIETIFQNRVEIPQVNNQYLRYTPISRWCFIAIVYLYKCSSTIHNTFHLLLSLSLSLLLLLPASFLHLLLLQVIFLLGHMSIPTCLLLSALALEVIFAGRSEVW